MWPSCSAEHADHADATSLFSEDTPLFACDQATLPSIMRFPSTPRLYLGTMTFGWSQSSSKVDTAIATEMVRHFLATDIDSRLTGHDGTKLHYVDTARIYAGGKTETILGEVLAALEPSERDSIVLGSKAHPSQRVGCPRKAFRTSSRRLWMQ